jgi:ATP-binding cassette, subfamily B (MDR/TAP), member 1
MLICTYTYMNIWVYTGEVNAKRLRERYLQAVLRQDIAFFDNVGAGEVATRIQTDTRASLRYLFPELHIFNNIIDLVQQGISEKVALVVSFLSGFFTGFIIAYIRSWRLALAMTSILPCLFIMGGLMNRFVSKYMRCV